MRQKRIALVNDITGFGRCSLTVQLPLISALKIQVCPLPTAVLSVHTGFPSYVLDDYTDRMIPYMKNWKENNIEFDGIVTGFLGSKEQISIVSTFIEEFKNNNTLVIVDPVMGDYGKLYASYTPEMCAEMRHLLQYANLTLPNLTEACFLLDIPYPKDALISDNDLFDIAHELSLRGPEKVVITGLPAGDRIKNIIYERNKKPTIHSVEKIGFDRSGTGDAFTAIVAGSILNGETLENAVKKSADFISLCLKYTVSLNLEWNHGLAFEEYLTTLR